MVKKKEKKKKEENIHDKESLWKYFGWMIVLQLETALLLLANMSDLRNDLLKEIKQN